MILEADQSFVLRHPEGQAAALAFVRQPAQALARIRFLRNLQADEAGIRGELLVTVPLLGEVDLPFRSRLHLTPDGATLEPEALEQERAWIGVAGQAQVRADGDMHFSFQFRGHLTMPAAEGWGGAAFEKMARAAANRTLERVAAALPAGMAASLADVSGNS